MSWLARIFSDVVLLPVQECGETAAWSFKDFGADNVATLTELLASFFVLYHTCIAQWCRDRSNGMRYRFLHLHVISNTLNTMFPVFCSCYTGPAWSSCLKQMKQRPETTVESFPELS